MERESAGRKKTQPVDSVLDNECRGDKKTKKFAARERKRSIVNCIRISLTLERIPPKGEIITGRNDNDLQLNESKERKVRHEIPVQLEAFIQLNRNSIPFCFNP